MVDLKYINRPIENDIRFKKVLIPVEKYQNGLTVYISDLIEEPRIIFTDLGSINDMYIGICGMLHFFEHYVFKDTYIKNILNASTGLNEINFFSESLDPKYFKTIIGFFYDFSKLDKNGNCEEKINQSNYFEDSDIYIENVKKEIENEYYYRISNFTANNPIYTLFNKPLYAGGRLEDFSDNKKLIKNIKNIWNSISGDQTYILLPEKMRKDILPIIKKTFANKTKKYNIEKKNIKINIPENNNNIKDPFVYINANNYNKYLLLFNFDIKDFDFLKESTTCLNYFSSFMILSDMYVIGNNLILIFFFANIKDFKTFLYILKNLDFNSIKDINKINSIISNTINCIYDDKNIINIITEMKILQKIGKKTPLEIYNIIGKFLSTLQNKLNKYGEYYIVTPNNNLLTTNHDIYNNGYSLLVSSLSNFLIDDNILLTYTDIPTINLLFYTNQDKKDSYNYKFYNSKSDFVCKYNSSDNKTLLYCYNKNIKLNKKQLYVNKSLLPRIINDNNLDIIGIDNKNYIIECDKNYKSILENKLYKNTLLDENIRLSLDIIGKAIRLYLIDCNNTLFSYLIYNILNNSLNNSLNTTCSYDSDLVFINDDRTLRIETPYQFLVFFFSLNNLDFNGLILEHYLKREGLIYVSKYTPFIFNNKIYYYLFYPTIYCNNVKTFVTNYIKSFDINSKIMIIESVVGSKYDFNELDNLFSYVKIFSQTI